MGNSDGVTRDLNSVSSNADEGLDTAARDEAALPRFLRTGRATPPAADRDYGDGKNLPAFMRQGAGPDGYGGVYSPTGESEEFSPAIQVHESPNANSRTQKPEVRAKRARNKKENAESDVVATTGHGGKAKKPWKRGMARKGKR